MDLIKYAFIAFCFVAGHWAYHVNKTDNIREKGGCWLKGTNFQLQQ